jgi:ubiquinone/menaquinone biosynthesis C-methylase UbiE
MDDGQLIDFFQSGFYETFWGWEFSEEEARETAEKSLELLGAKNGHILDWCGGWGRISLYLAQKGFKITILDFVAEYLARARNIFKSNGLEVTTVKADCRKTPKNIRADYALCAFNSIGFLSDAEQLKAFKSLFRALKTKGKVIIDCINQLFIAKYFSKATESKRPDGISCLKQNSFDLLKGILYSDLELANAEGKVIDKKQFAQRIYTPMELKSMLESAGFKVLDMYGSFEGDDLAFDLPQIVAVAEK